MFAYDVNGDGRPDVITSLATHGFGLVWWEQLAEKEAKGEPQFKQHVIINKEPNESRYGVKFSQLHAIDLVDMDGDGLKDIVTGKRFWAHGNHGDAEPDAPAVLYWFKLTRGKDGSVDWVPHLIDDNSGVGTQITIGDVNGDGLPDVISGSKESFARGLGKGPTEGDGEVNFNSVLPVLVGESLWPLTVGVTFRLVAQ